MIQHVKLFGLIINLIIGTGIVFYVYQMYKSYAYSFLKSLAHYTILFNFLFWGLFISGYTDLNLPKNLLHTSIPVYNEFVDLFLTLLIIGWLYSMSRIVLGFLGRDISHRLKKWTAIVCIVFVLSYGAKMLLPTQYFGWLVLIDKYVIENIILLELVFLIGLLIYGKRSPDHGIVKVSKAFGYLYLLRYVIVGIFLLFVLLIKVPESFRFIISFGVLMFFNIIPFLWIKYFFLEYAQSMLKLVDGKAVLNTVFEKYNISKREQEIIKLILNGKSNKEIEDTLYISYHTVKNHIYNLYQKLGVKTRYEMVHFFTKFQVNAK